eukprot:4652326-Pyramimonas_sp.AAC.1
MARQGRVNNKGGSSSSSSGDSGSERPPRRERLEKALSEGAQQSVGDGQKSPVRSEGENSLQEE